MIICVPVIVFSMMIVTEIFVLFVLGKRKGLGFQPQQTLPAHPGCF